MKIYGYGIDFFEDFDKLNGNTINTHVDPVITKASAEKQYKFEGLSNFTLLKGNSSEMLKSLPKLENVVCFIDSNHTYDAVKVDFSSAASIMKNGYICLDDCNAHELPNGEYGIFKFFSEIQFLYKIVYRDSRNVVIKIK